MFDGPFILGDAPPALCGMEAEALDLGDDMVRRSARQVAPPLDSGPVNRSELTTAGPG